MGGRRCRPIASFHITHKFISILIFPYLLLSIDALHTTTASPDPAMRTLQATTRLLVFLSILLPRTGMAQPAEGVIRVGVIGLDTSHSPAFARLMNDPAGSPATQGVEVVAAYPYGSRAIASSARRIPEITATFEAMGIDLVGSIDELLTRVDAVLLETNDGNLHLAQALPVLKAGKPLFIDKPMAASLTDVIALFEAARHYDTPLFSSSSLRYKTPMQAVRRGSIGEVLGAQTYSPAKLEPSHADLAWYAIHGVEALFTVMGTGCAEVTRFHTADADVVVGRWADDRIGIFRGMREGTLGYGGAAFGTDGIAALQHEERFEMTVDTIAVFFRTGVAPVRPEETIEIFAFMEAADESKRRGGAPVRLDEVLARARAEARTRWTADR